MLLLTSDHKRTGVITSKELFNSNSDQLEGSLTAVETVVNRVCQSKVNVAIFWEVCDIIYWLPSTEKSNQWRIFANSLDQFSENFKTKTSLFSKKERPLPPKQSNSAHVCNNCDEIRWIELPIAALFAYSPDLVHIAQVKSFVARSSIAFMLAAWNMSKYKFRNRCSLLIANWTYFKLLTNICEINGKNGVNSDEYYGRRKNSLFTWRLLLCCMLFSCLYFKPVPSQLQQTNQINSWRKSNKL